MPVLPGNDQDLDHENIVNTYLFYQVCKVNDIVSETSIPMQNSHDTLASDIPKTGVLDDNYINTKSLPKLCQNFNKNLIETPVLGRSVWT